MTASQIERRLAALEAEVEKLKASPKRQNRWWEEIAGTFADDPLFDKAMRLGRLWQDEEPTPPPSNGRSRSRHGKTK